MSITLIDTNVDLPICMIFPNIKNSMSSKNIVPRKKDRFYFFSKSGWTINFPSS